MGGKKQDSISSFFIEIPPSNTNNNTNSIPVPQLQSLDSTTNGAGEQAVLPALPITTNETEVLPVTADAAPLHVTDKPIHPFFGLTNNAQKNKPERTKSDKSTSNPPKIQQQNNDTKVMKSKKRGRKRKEIPGGNINLLFQQEEPLDIVVETANSDGDFPTPSPTGSSESNESDIENASKWAPPKKRKKGRGEAVSIPSPPRSSETGTQDLVEVGHVASSEHHTTGENSDATPPNITQTEERKDIQAQLSNLRIAEVPGGVRSAFDVMKRSASTTKTRSRSRSPPIVGVEEPPLKKARTRGRPRKSLAIVDDSLVDDLVAVSEPGSTLKPSLVIALRIGKEAAAKLERPPEEPESLVVTLRIDKDKLQALTPKPHPFFMKTSEKRKQIPPENVETKAVVDPKPDQKPAANTSLFQRERKPKFKVEHYAAWPAREAMHVRSFGSDEVLPNPPSHNLRNASIVKGKIRRSRIPSEESVLQLLRNKYVRLQQTRSYHGDPLGLPIPQPTIRLPERHLLGARDILGYLKQELSFNSSLCSESTHPAIRELLSKVGNGDLRLTAFDTGDCETQSWTTLYAPTSSRCVLQTGQEARELSKWLACMKITAVDTGTNPKPKTTLVKKKKKPKHELDDFIVSEDDDHDSMDELTDPEDTNVLLPGLYASRKSEIRRKGRCAVNSIGTSVGRNPQTASPTKLPNAILISGPSGIGKTAAVYAAAKEHDFVVFEINAGSKRGGKEIQEMVGDMSRNHLVHQAKSPEQGRSEPEAPGLPALNGINPFFKRQNAPLQKKDDKSYSEPTKEKEKVKQQQSLILIEEADILFEEDKGFWSSIIALVEKSRRPVIITCNDESRLELGDLDLYAKLRFKPASADVASDYLTAMTAAQGHLLDRSTIRGLYENFDYDLRRTITHLNFWCQMAVGDRTWCGKWFYSRDDPDKSNERTPHGDIKRSISGGTYTREMDSFGRELLLGEDGELLTLDEYDETAVWKDVMDGCGVDIGDRFYHEGLEKGMQFMDSKASVRAYSDYIDSLSMLDSFGGLAAMAGDGLRESLNPNWSGLKLKSSPDNLAGIKVLDAEKKIDPLSTSSLISITAQILARNVISDTCRPHASKDLDTFFAPLTELDIVDMVTSQRAFSRRHQWKTQDELRYPFDRIAIGYTQLVGPIATFVEIIPYIREIARFDLQNEQEAREISSLLSQRPGGGGKKRTTRASAFASEGRSRGGGRPKTEQYFRGSLKAMIETGGGSWGDAVEFYTERPKSESPAAVGEDQSAPMEVDQPQVGEANAAKGCEAPRTRRIVVDDDDDIEDYSSDA
ncbi:hypothetical protein TWF696_006461 [Orbilia brochopaga]|uniref:AAA+ ATPase domain-containing protein n=1 Tax=Orbilia brochopaga TaxID=3140254 RepID=A0AAV9UWF1_9PEZI